MAVKQKDKIPTKSTFEANDSLLAFTPNGARRISQSAIGDYLNLFKAVYLSVAAKTWIRVAHISGTNPAGLLLITTGYSGKSPVPLACFIGGNTNDIDALTCTRLSPVKGKTSGTAANPSFPEARFVRENGAIYFELKTNATESSFWYSFIGATKDFTLLTISASTSQDLTVLKTFDLTAPVDL